MNTHDQRAEEILATAMGMADPAAKRAYLDRACANDAALRQEVESLLAAHEQAGGFMATAAMPGAPHALPTEQAGDRIGRYKLLEQIGEGGFGVVWMAEQEEPVRRRVALKIIKLGMDTKEVVARFEAERQALAMMDHPNIAKVFDGGAIGAPGSEISNLKSEIPLGRPYFVMELVKGIPITEYCDAAKLSTAERLDLFMQVCQAVQHAHQKGVIHRDLKPSNVLVTVQDDRPVPKVIDFGVAKATQARLTEKTLFTKFNQWIGTPAYMSPEQAGLGSLDVDTRSDVYSLGVLLYELLTGRPPFDTQKLLAAGYDAVMRTIREDEPPKPSTRLSTLAAEELSAVAAKRGAEPTKLGRLMRGDLDWIVMKAMEKDRARRYETANALGQDIQRHLGNEPVLARPPSSVYRLQKLIHRNKLLFAAGGVVSASLVLGLGVSTVLFFKERAAREIAVAAEEEAQEARANEAVLRQQAEAEQRKALTEANKRAQVARFLEDMLRGVGPSVALGRDTVLLREILSNTVVRVTKDLADQPEIGAELLNTIGEVYAALGQYERAEEMHHQALEAAVKGGGSESLQAARAHHGLGTAFLGQGKYAGGQTQHRKALEIRTKLLGNAHPEVVNSIEALAFALQCCQEFTEAERLFAHALGVKQQLLGSNHVSVATTLDRFGQFLQNRGRSAEAEPLFRQALAIQTERMGTNDSRIALLQARFAVALENQGNPAEAEAVLRDALAANRRLYGADHPATANSIGNLTHILLKQGKQDAIEALFREELATARARYPKYPAERSDGVYRVLGGLLSEGAYPEAERIVNTLLNPALAAQPDSLGVLLNHGRFLARRSRFPEAATDYARMVSLEPTNPHPWYMLATLLAEAGNVEAYHDHRQRMLAQFGQTTDPGLMETTAKACLLLPASGAELAVAVELGRKSPSLGSSHPFVPYFELAAGLAEYRQGQYGAAEQWTRKSLSHNWSNANLQAPNHLVLAMTLHRQGNPNEARLHFAEGAAMVRGTWPESRPGDLGGDWFDWLIARVLLREAMSLVEDAP